MKRLIVPRLSWKSSPGMYPGRDGEYSSRVESSIQYTRVEIAQGRMYTVRRALSTQEAPPVGASPAPSVLKRQSEPSNIG